MSPVCWCDARDVPAPAHSKHVIAGSDVTLAADLLAHIVHRPVKDMHSSSVLAPTRGQRSLYKRRLNERRSVTTLCCATSTARPTPWLRHVAEAGLQSRTWHNETKLQGGSYFISFGKTRYHGSYVSSGGRPSATNTHTQRALYGRLCCILVVDPLRCEGRAAAVDAHTAGPIIQRVDHSARWYVRDEDSARFANAGRTNNVWCTSSL